MYLYKFEIYNNGKRLLIESEQNPEAQEVLDANGELVTVIPKRQRFYENQLPQPLSENQGKVVGVWTNPKKILNFEFDNTIIVNYADGNQKSYLYVSLQIPLENHAKIMFRLFLSRYRYNVPLIRLLFHLW